MAGSDEGFDAAEFRDGIRSAMLLGLPVATVDQPTFQWDTARTFAAPSSSGAPWSWTEVPSTTSSPTAVTATCQVITSLSGAGAEFFASVGEINEDEAVILMFDEEYAVVGDFDSVKLSQNVYRRVKELNRLALHDVGIHLILVRAVDES